MSQGSWIDPVKSSAQKETPILNCRTILAYPSLVDSSTRSTTVVTTDPAEIPKDDSLAEWAIIRV